MGSTVLGGQFMVIGGKPGFLLVVPIATQLHHNIASPLISDISNISTPPLRILFSEN